MSEPNDIETTLLKRSEELLQFAAENKTGLSAEVIADIEDAWNAQSQSNWNPQIATKFWAAYDKLCTHLRPVTLDTLHASQPSETRLSRLGLRSKRSSADRWAGWLQMLLLVVFLVSMFLSYISTTGEILLNDMNDSLKHADNTVETIRDLLAQRPSEIGVDTDFDKPALEAASRTWANKLRTQLIDLWTTADKLYENTDRISRLLHLGEYRLCKPDEYPSADTVCYYRGTIKQPPTLQDVLTNMDTFYNYFETRRVIAKRTDEAARRLAGIKAYFLPALLGMLGACTYVVRAISDQIKDFTFSPASPLRHGLRVMLGPIVGIVVVTFGGLTIEKLSAPAWAFVAGYAMEAVFAAIDSIAAKLRS
jgi:hypothetical protein